MVVLIFYAIALTIAASVAATLFGLLTYFLLRTAPSGGKRAITASVLFPFASVLYAGIWFIAYAMINYSAFGRDPMLGDTWQTPLPNGYALMMIDTTDQGTVYNPKTQGNDGSISSRDDAVFGVRQLQISRNLIFGARDKDYFHRLGQESKLVDAYFERDTTKKTHVEFNSIDEFSKRSSAPSGIPISLW